MAEVLPFPAPEPGPEERPVLVLDLGGQYAQLIARRVRECRVYSELVPHSISATEVRRRNAVALVLSGGPASVLQGLKSQPVKTQPAPAQTPATPAAPQK